MSPSTQLIDQLFADKVLAARQRTLEEKFLAGGNLFLAAVERMKIGILMRNPNATDEQIQAEIQRRLAVSRHMENRE
ncbi:MAG TPA: hypothetical protein VM008_19565 [Phycisphaerae bacterium]|nr:hypothetical protein [Phycisphaerae bacterium]